MVISFACHSESQLSAPQVVLRTPFPVCPAVFLKRPWLFPVAPLIRSKRSGRQRVHCPSLAETILHPVRGDFRTCEKQPYHWGATPAEPGLAHPPVVGLGGGRDHDRLLHPLVSRSLPQMGLVLLLRLLLVLLLVVFLALLLILLSLVVLLGLLFPDCAPP
jgi:hypothetical protein